MRFLQMFVVAVVGLSIIYCAISLYSASVRREKLEKLWHAENPDSDDLSARRAYVKAGMESYHSGFRKKLIWLVYVVPLVAMAVIYYLTNTN